MSNDHFKPSNPFSLFVQEKKEKRRKVLEAVRQRRKEIEKSFQRKVQQRS
jgi:hypothetical protein